MKIIVFCALLLASNLALAEGTPPCFRSGQQITVKGSAAQVSLKDSDRNANSVWILTTDSPLCVSEKNQALSHIRQIQIIGSPPPVGEAVELTGKLTTGNSSDNFAVPDAIRVTKGIKLSYKNPSNLISENNTYQDSTSLKNQPNLLPHDSPVYRVCSDIMSKLRNRYSRAPMCNPLIGSDGSDESQETGAIQLTDDGVNNYFQITVHIENPLDSDNFIYSYNSSEIDNLIYLINSGKGLTENQVEIFGIKQYRKVIELKYKNGEINIKNYNEIIKNLDKGEQEINSRG